MARFAYGHTLFALGKYQRAAEAVRKGLELDPTWPGVRMDRRNFYRDPSQFEAQLKKLEQYVAQHPEDGDARFLLAYNLYFSGQKGRAREEFGTLIKTNPLDAHSELFLKYLAGAPGPAAPSLPAAPKPTAPAPKLGGTEY